MEERSRGLKPVFEWMEKLDTYQKGLMQEEVDFLQRDIQFMPFTNQVLGGVMRAGVQLTSTHPPLDAETLARVQSGRGHILGMNWKVPILAGWKELSFIWMHPQLSANHALKVITHEMGHHFFTDMITPAGIAETDAESFSFLVAQRLGIDTSRYAANYLLFSEGSVERMKAMEPVYITAAEVFLG